MSKQISIPKDDLPALFAANPQNAINEDLVVVKSVHELDQKLRIELNRAYFAALNLMNFYENEIYLGTSDTEYPENARVLTADQVQEVIADICEQNPSVKDNIIVTSRKFGTTTDHIIMIKFDS